MASHLSLVQPVVPWEELLLEPRSGTGGPHPVALRLVDLPIIRAVQKLEAPEHPDGRLPVHAYTARLQGRRPNGSAYDVIVKGDDKHGLPYGSDGDIFFALFKIADELPEPERTHLFTTGEFRDPTVGMIARAMGRPMNGETSRRIREALHRLAHLRIEMHVSQEAQEIGTLLLSEVTGAGGGSVAQLHPAEPDGGPVPRPRKGVDTVGVLHVLEYAVSRTYDRRAEGEDWIAHLQINPVWLRELAGGWAAWISVERYVAMRSPIAKRLYQLFAGEAARGVLDPWTFTLAELQARCGTVGIARRPAAVRDSVHEAANELVLCDILAAVECEQSGRGRYTFTFAAGAQLRMAALLRGVGALDLRELRVHRMLLRYFGVTRDATDRMLAERPSRVHDALQYLLYVRDTDRARVKRSWSAYLLKLVDGDANLAGDVRYQAWLARQRRQVQRRDVVELSQSGAGGMSGSAERLAVAPGAAAGFGAARDAGPVADGAQLVLPALRAPVLDAARTVPVSRDASALWVQVKAAAAARYSPTHRAYVEDLVAFDLGGDTLTCVTSTEFTLRMLESAGLAGIEAELSAASAGAVSQLHVEAFQRGRHTP
jgi:hypothetical protein